MNATRLALSLAAFSLAACSAPRSGLLGTDAGGQPDLGGDAFLAPDTGGVDSGGIDSGGIDSGSIDSGDVDLGGIDSGTDFGIDMPPPPPDLGTDLGPACTPGCSTDGAATITCAGAVPTATHCDRGCDSGTGACRPMVACTFTTFGTLVPGTTRYNLCGAGDEHDRIFSTACAIGASGEEVALRFEVDVAGHYTIDVEDVSGGYRVDPVVYVDSACNDATTQLGCDDDGGSSVDSSLGIDLPAGEYFVFVDSIDTEAGGTGCGNVDVTVTRD